MHPGFIDIHCHLIPGIDDGPETMEESLQMCRMAYEDGSETIVATPHVNPGVFDNDWETISAGFNSLEKAVKSAGIPLQLYAGADVRMNEMLMKNTDPDEFITINHNNVYMLLEFPDSLIPPNTDHFIFNIKLKGITPILTHPERNYEVQRNPNILFHLVNMGTLVQITAMSLIGEFGENLRDLCELLLTSNLVHVVASDAHSVNHRPPLLREAFNLTAELIGEKQALCLFTDTPGKIVAGEEITPEEPNEITSGHQRFMSKGIRKFKKFFNLFHSGKGG
ncbi:MAG: hypothetical protein A2161_14360 [Candidatus Schekmanbacteria bacterium RBG_13_48_7]|uniref:protein-tyrosine-phosphatase n=1 Tax=Candidatus Schekmanbacteria bacterium RBG_13_48_7 TaxID=1817878 RepID=A0A1F7RPN9_9BACT|nr:MAG: hypothetical protein A2161_14360 [Candidatus Schekmanbacteria bacterium RBG_13_48_7]